MNSSSLSSLTAALMLCSPVLAFAVEAERYTVMPFAAVSGDVPPRAGQKAAGMLSTELKNVDGLEVVDAKKPTDDASTQALGALRAKVEQAKQLREQRKFGKAEETLHQALAELRTNAGHVTDVGEVADVYALLAAVQYNTGRDDDGLKSLKAALTLSPGRPLPLAKTSPSFGAFVEQTRSALEAGPKGTLVVESVPAGAPVWLDGQALGKTPLSIRDVPAGFHHYRVQLPGAAAGGGFAEVQAQRTAQVAVHPQGADANSKLAGAVASNRMGDAVVAAVKTYAQTAQASHVVFGALAKDGAQLALYPFVLQAGTGQVRRLPKASFDAELLSAGVELLKLAAQIPKAGTAAPLKLPSSIATDRVDARERPVEVRYTAATATSTSEGTATEAPATEAATPARAPLDTGSTRKPLTRPK